MNCIAKVFVIFVVDYPKYANKLELRNINKPVFINQTFNDFECFRDAASMWSLDFKQLDSGKLNADLQILETAHVQIGTTTLNRKFEQKGIAPNGFCTVVLTSTSKQFYQWRGYNVTGRDLLIHAGSGEFQSISKPGWGIFTIAISNDFINQFKENFEIGRNNFLDDGSEVVTVSLPEIENLRYKLNSIFNAASFLPGKIHSRAIQQFIFNDIPSMLLQSILRSAVPRSRPDSRLRDIALKKAITYLNESPYDNPSISELCNIAGASQRTLEYAFNETYEFGPKEYIRKNLLNRVREVLRNANPAKTKVQDVAHRYGFLHLGHFGSDYKKLFQELPSETLLKKK